MTSSMRNRLLAVGGLVLAGVLVVVVFFGGSKGHDVYVTVPTATGVLDGQSVRAGGSVVGQIADISPVDRGRAARLHLKISDDAWPLRKGATLVLRWAGTVNQYNRHLTLEQGPPDAPAAVRDGGTLPAKVFKEPVEFGELLGIFNRKVRSDLKATVDTAGATFDAAGPALHRALEDAPAALTQADQVLRDLTASQTALKTLVRSTGSVVDAIQTADPQLGDMIVGAGTTFAALADEAESLKQTLADAPGTFRSARTTLARADGTIDAARRLTGRLGPGVSELRRLSGPLNGMLRELEQVAPSARSTLATLAGSSGDLTRLLVRARTVMPRIESISKQADPQLACIRPYTPELAAFGSLWGSALSSTDGKDKYIRAQVQAFLPSLTNNRYDTPATAARLAPGLKYAFPRPPGYMAGDPWFLPECGIGPESLDPSQDPEARQFTPMDQIDPPPARERNGR